MTGSTIHLACSPDARFARDCAAMLGSLLESNDPRSIHLHLLHDERLPPADLEALQAVAAQGGAACTAITVDDERLHHLPSSERFPPNAWYRIFLPDLLPDAPRALYLDSDTLVLGDLRPLWTIDLGSDWLGAVTNPLFERMVPRIRTDVGVPTADRYFNSGVLLIDLAAWRTHGVVDALVDFARRRPHLEWPDQDTLNGVLHDHRLRLRPRWNAMPGIWELPRRYLPYGDEEIAEAAIDPAIVHFVGPYKPWHHRSLSPHRSAYVRHLEGTPWADPPIEGRTLDHAVLRRLPPLWAARVEHRSWQLRQAGSTASRRARRELRRWQRALRP